MKSTLTSTLTSTLKSALKTIIKTIIPQAFRQHLMDAKARISLKRGPVPKLDLACLPAAGDFDKEVLNQFDTEFTAAHEKIAALVGEENLFHGVNPGDRQALFKLIMARKPKAVLEVGTHIGLSSYYFAAALESCAGHLTTVDIDDVNAPGAAWSQCGMPHPPHEVLNALGWGKNVDFIARPAQDYLRDATQMFDFIFLDGDHTAHSVFHEVRLALPRLNPGGFIILHDYYPKGRALFPNGHIILGPYRALEILQSSNPGLTVQNLSPLPWETKEDSFNTSLAILLKT